MFQIIVRYGVIAGLIVGTLLFGLTVAMGDGPPLRYGVAIGYLTMLLALSAVFAGIKHYRDVNLGGVIRFWPAFGMGLGISFIAGVFYVLAWEAALAVTQVDFGHTYAQYLIEQGKSRGLQGEELAKLVAEMNAFELQYANPLFRLPMTFTEIFPVGVLVSLISAGLLRVSRFLPARRGG